jgi:hypothetical protein
MKKYLYFLTLAIFLIAGCTNKLETQNGVQVDSTGLPGDHFSLAGALALFKISASADDFERKLNSKSNIVNNLDLNGDSLIDFVRVNVNKEKDASTVVLQVSVSATEVQDVAVIELQQMSNAKVSIQIVGNPLLYGDSMILEPSKVTVSNAALVPGFFVDDDIDVQVQISAWPMAAQIFQPTYVMWNSPWGWQHFPTWYSPLPHQPYGWYRSRVAHYGNEYTPVAIYRVGPAHMLYLPMASNSVYVLSRYKNNFQKHGMPKMKGKNYYEMSEKIPDASFKSKGGRPMQEMHKSSNGGHPDNDHGSAPIRKSGNMNKGSGKGSSGSGGPSNSGQKGHGGGKGH